MSRTGSLQYAVRDIIRQDIPYHGFDVCCNDGQVLVTQHQFLVRIKFDGEDMVVSLDVSNKTVLNAMNKRIPLADPKCFEDLKTVILAWFL